MRALDQKMRELARPGLCISHAKSGGIHIAYVEEVRLKAKWGRAAWSIEIASLEPREGLGN